MNKKGFTLTELLVVIAIIAILSVIIIPSVVKINESINTRLYNQKVEYIVSAAELFGSNNPDIFNGVDKVNVYVWELIDANYLEIDAKYGSGSCKTVDTGEVDKYNKGCIVDPRANASTPLLNEQYVTLTKKTVGVVGQFVGSGTVASSTSDTLVAKVCAGFTHKNNEGNIVNGEYDGMYLATDGTYKRCGCSEDLKSLISLDEASANITACIIVSNKSSGEVNNWLKYGSSSANWRVLGIYTVNGKLSAKMITSSVVQ